MTHHGTTNLRDLASFLANQTPNLTDESWVPELDCILQIAVPEDPWAWVDTKGPYAHSLASLIGSLCTESTHRSDPVEQPPVETLSQLVTLPPAPSATFFLNRTVYTFVAWNVHLAQTKWQSSPRPVEPAACHHQRPEHQAVPASSKPQLKRQCKLRMTPTTTARRCINSVSPGVGSGQLGDETLCLVRPFASDFNSKNNEARLPVKSGQFRVCPGFPSPGFS